MKRREVLGMLGALMGGAAFVGPVGCSDDDSTVGGPDGGGPDGGGPDGVAPDGSTPSAYRFHSVFQGSGVPLFADDGNRRLEDSDGQTLPHIVGEPIFSDGGQLYFVAVDENDIQVLYTVSVDFSKASPAIGRPAKVLAVGDTVDGDRVIALGTIDLSPGGTLVVVLRLERDVDEQSGTFKYRAVYADRGSGLERILGDTLVTSDGHRMRGILGHVSAGDDFVLMAARYEHAQSEGYRVASTGLIQVPLNAPKDAKILVRRGDTPEGIGAPIQEFGLVHTDNDSWTCEAYVRFNPSGVEGKEETHTVILRGTFDDTEPTVVTVTHEKLEPTGSQARVVAAATVPRLYDGSIHVMQQDEQRVMHQQDGDVLARTADRSTSGRDVLGIAPLVASTKTQAFFTQVTVNEYDKDDTLYRNATIRELIRVGNDQSQVILQSGDLLSDDARQVWDISLGAWTRQADSQGRVAFAVLFAEEGTDPTQPPFPAAIVIGVPV